MVFRVLIVLILHKKSCMKKNLRLLWCEKQKIGCSHARGNLINDR